MKKKNRYLRANNIGLMTDINPVIKKSSSGILSGGYRYTYVLNNPLKYTDPSGYEFLKIDPAEEAMYYQMQIIIEDWNYRNQHHGTPEGVVRSGGGGGGIGGYTHFNGQYYFEGQPVPEAEARNFAIEPNASMTISYLEARYSMLDKSTAWATFYYELSLQPNQKDPPNKVNLYDDPIEGFIEWFHFIQANRSYHYKENITYNVNDIVDENTIIISIHLNNLRLNHTEDYKGHKVEWNISDFEFYKKGHYDANYVLYAYADNPCDNLYRITLYYNYEAKITLNTTSYEAWEDMRSRIFDND